MSNVSLHKPKNHRDKKHPQRKNDDIDALFTKRVYDLQATPPHLGFTQCSYKVAYRTVKCKKPHNIAEELITSCTEKMVKIIIALGTKKIQPVLLPNNTICQQIDDMVAKVF